MAQGPGGGSGLGWRGLSTPVAFVTTGKSASGPSPARCCPVRDRGMLLSWSQPQASALVPPSVTSGGLLALKDASTPVTPESVSSPAGTHPQAQPPAPVRPELSHGHHTPHNTEPTPGPISGTRPLFSHMLVPKPRGIVASLSRTPHPTSTLPRKHVETSPSPSSTACTLL